MTGAGRVLVLAMLPLLLAGTARAEGWDGHHGPHHGHGREFRQHHVPPHGVHHGSWPHHRPQHHGFHRPWHQDHGWQRGAWRQGHHHGHSGWWWVVGNTWHLYGSRVYPYPAQRPIVIVQSSHPVTILPPATPLPAEQVSSTYIDSSGRSCREYQSDIVVGGDYRQAYGTACLQPDGTWRAVR